MYLYLNDSRPALSRVLVGDLCPNTTTRPIRLSDLVLVSDHSLYILFLMLLMVIGRRFTLINLSSFEFKMQGPWAALAKLPRSGCVNEVRGLWASLQPRLPFTFFWPLLHRQRNCTRNGECPDTQVQEIDDEDCSIWLGPCLWPKLLAPNEHLGCWSGRPFRCLTGVIPYGEPQANMSDPLIQDLAVRTVCDA